MSIDFVTVTHKAFEPLLGDDFSVETQTGDIILKLDKIKLNDHIRPRDNILEVEGKIYPPRTSFVLTFSGPAKPTLDSNSYYVSHKAIGKKILFLSAFTADEENMYYETIFN